jgi:putative transcriptional regulator
MLCSIYTTYMSRNQEDPLFNRIEAARNSLGISRTDLAELTNVHYQTIGYIERGEYNPSLALAIRLAQALDVEVSEIFSTKPFRKDKNNG